MIRIIYVSPACNDPDWDGTVTEQTDIHLFSTCLFIYLKVLYSNSIYVLIITQVSEDIEGRFTKKLYQEFSRTKSRILGALSNLDEYLLNPQVRTFSETVPRTSRNNDVENQEPTLDRCQNDLHSEVEFSVCRSRNSFDSSPEELSHTFDCSSYYLSFDSHKTSAGKS